MQRLAVELRHLSDVTGRDLRLTPGRGLMARVVAADGRGRGMLNIAGALLEAELPRHVQAGEELRLTVRSLDEHRVVLELPREGGAPAPAPSLPPAAIALPGGGALRTVDEDRGAGSGPGGGGAGQSADVHTLALRYDAPALGPLDLRFELHPDGLRVTIATAAGDPLERLEADAPALREALGARSERPVAVTIVPRREPLDVYA
jgi:hypothetical protein